MADYKEYINALRKCAKEHEDDRTLTGRIIVADLCRDTANLLEELEQEPKTGHWIVQRRVGFGEWKNCIIPIEDGFVTNDCHCSMCGEEMSKGDRGVFCPNCGAKMIDPKERSEE